MRKTKHSTWIHKLISGMLVLLFLSIISLQTIHTHQQASVYRDVTKDHQYFGSAKDCKICEYLAHIQYKLYDVTHFVWSAPFPDSSQLKIEADAHICELTLQVLFNKGPPALIFA